jgi:S1-C subfamily serine protease
VNEKLRRVGLELVGEAAAGIPPDRHGRYLPCRVIPGCENPALAPHPAGYLLVGVDGKPTADAGAIRAALAAWRPGEVLSVTVRRNPYRFDRNEWWESEVRLWLPGR